MADYTIKWTPSSGPAIFLSGESYYTALEGDTGLLMPNVSLVMDYFQRHAVISRVRMDPRIINIPLYVQTSTPGEMDTAIDALCSAFNPLAATEGTLRITRHDGVIREIKAIYWSGLEGARSRDMYNGLWYKVNVSLKCPNHLWYDPTQVTYAYSTETPSLFFPIFPLQLSAGALFGNSTVTNPGTAESWPVWEIDGPATNPTIANVTTGKTLSLTLSILTGETLIIDTNPGVKTIKIGSLNKFATTSIGSSLWPLEPGDQTVKITLTGTDSNSEVRLGFYPRYISL